MSLLCIFRALNFLVSTENCPDKILCLIPLSIDKEKSYYGQVHVRLWLVSRRDKVPELFFRIQCVLPPTPTAQEML